MVCKVPGLAAAIVSCEMSLGKGPIQEGVTLQNIPIEMYCVEQIGLFFIWKRKSCQLYSLHFYLQRLQTFRFNKYTLVFFSSGSPSYGAKARSINSSPPILSFIPHITSALLSLTLFLSLVLALKAAELNRCCEGNKSTGSIYTIQNEEYQYGGQVSIGSCED
jgi:hypothetical protein